MPNSKFTPRALILALLALTLFLPGCWSSKFTLIKQDDARVDKNLLGNWNALNAKGESATLIIRNIDDKNYYIETHDSAKQYPEGVSRYIGFTAPLKDATFAHLKELQPDGNVPEEWLLVRIELKNDKLTIRHLKDEFMKSKTITTPDQLRQVLEQNLDDTTMYDPNETITATRTPQN